MPAALVLVSVLTLTTVAPQSPPAAPPLTSTIRGTIVDARTSAPIADARVQLVEPARTTQTSADGRFEFANLPGGAFTLTVSTIGYIFVHRRVEVAAGARLDLTLPLAEGAGTYQETVTVTAELARPFEAGVSSQSELGSSGLQDLRGVIADDPMRAVQSLPGVATGDDFQAEFSVRGSAFRHLGVVLDGTATPLLMHSVHGVDDTGSIAMINTDVLAAASLRAGPHAPRHGDWLGATLEFDVREGSRDRTMVRGAVSGTSASFVVEGPLDRRGRGSWLVSMRKSYLDWLVRKVEPNVDSTIGYFDGQAKFVYDIASRHQLQVVVIGGEAEYHEEQTSIANGLLRANMGTTLASAAWRYTRGRWVASQRLSFVGSDFNNHGLVGQELARGYRQSMVWRGDVTAVLGNGWTLDAGLKHERQRMNETLRNFVPQGSTVRLREVRSLSPRTTLMGGWAQVSRETPNGSLTGGVRVSDRTLSDRTTVSPWLLAERRTGSFTWRAGAGAAAQFPDPLLTFGDDPIGPERAWSIDAGVERGLGHGIRWELAAFHRNESNVLRPIDEAHVDPVTGERTGEARFPAYRSTLDGSTHGVDVVVRRRAASGLTGWIAYTWAHTRAHDVVTGERFDADFDQRHTLNVVLLQRLSYRMTVGAKLRVGSNFPIVGYYEERPDGLWLSTGRNGARLPTYARLDLRGSRTFTFDRRRLTLFVEVMNALGHDNYGQSDGAILPSLQAIRITEKLIPFVPSAGILIEF